MKGKGRILKSGIILAIIIAIIGVFVFVNADNSKSYVVEVVNAKDLETDGKDNTEIKIKKSIVKDNKEQPYYNEKNLTYQLDVSNMIEKKNLEVALIVDTSYSMQINDKETLIKGKANELVSEIFANCSGAKIQLFNAAGAKTNKLASNGQSTIVTTINSLQTGDGNNILNGINAAQTAFSTGENVEKYIILLTDATDNVKSAIEQINTNDIKIISILMNNIISNSYIENDKPIEGKIQMVYNSTFEDSQKLYDEFDVQTITNILNSSLLNIKVTDEFTYSLKEYFDFELVTTSEIDNVEKTENGFIWNIDEIKSGETKSLQFKLNIKENINISDPQYVYHELAVSDKITAEYEMKTYESEEIIKDTFEVSKEYMPIIKICNKYSITLVAVSEENYALTVEGVEFNVVAKDINGNIVYNQKATSNANGEILVDNLMTTGKVTFEITPTLNLKGYDKTDSSIIEISNEFGTNFSVDTIEWQDKSTINNTKRNITIKYPINTQKFKLEVNLSEINNSNVQIGNTEFRLIQPKLNNQYELSAKFAETDESGKAVFTPTIMTKAGTYEYILSQMTVQDGYISMGNVTLRIKFDENGYIIEKGATAVHNENVTAERVTTNYVKVNVQNTTEKEDMFNLELNLTDKDNSKKKIENAEYDIEVTRVSGGNQVKTTYKNCKTNEKGKLIIDLPGSGNVQLKITQVKSAVGYKVDTEAKIVTINRKDGTVTAVLQAYNEDTLTPVDASPYSSENKLIVNLTNEIQHERNMLNILLTDAEEEDIPLSKIELELTNSITQQVYNATTDDNGLATFQIDDQNQGDYSYILKVKSALPRIYAAIPNSIINIHFDGSKHMQMVSDAWDDNSELEDPILYIDPVELIENGEFSDYTSTVHIGANLNAASLYDFKINLKDKNNSKLALEGATYDIQMISGDIERNIKNRKTDASGTITTKIIQNEEIEIIVTQTSSTTGYKIDNSTKEIRLIYRNGIMKLADENTTDVVISGNAVIYNHTNVKKSSEDVRLNLVINKEDINGFVSGQTRVRIFQETGTNPINGAKTYISATNGYIDQYGNKIGTWINESGEASEPIPVKIAEDIKPEDSLNIRTTTDNLGTISLEGLKINGVPTPGEAMFILGVIEVDGVTGQDKDGTLVKYKITYRYNTNKEIIEITNVEQFYGNRLVKPGSTTFDGYESYLGYESNIYTTIYTNYEDVGNLSIDLKKFDKEQKELSGAKYKIRVLKPDGSILEKTTTVDNGTIEMPGTLVTKGSQIILTEVTAPIGYGINQNNEIIDVVNIDETGEITLQAQSNYNPTRIVLEKEQVYQTTSGSLKTEYVAKLIDYELDTVKIKITAIDKETNERVPGYSFKIVTDKGAHKLTSATDKNGEVETVVGGHYEEQIVKYNISKNTNAKYYKDIIPFDVDVQFNSIKKVDDSTLSIQQDSNFDKTWKINQVNVVDRNDIELEVYLETEDPLVVEIETIDAISKNKLINTTYEIEPTVQRNGLGTGVLDETTQITTVKVGYVERSASKLYTLKTTIPENYIQVPDQLFTVYYDQNGDITQVVTPNSDTLKIVSFNGKKMKIQNFVEPRQGIQIVNKDYFTGQNITEAEFEITRPDGEVVTLSTGLTGIGAVLGGQNGEPNSTVRYKIHQTKRADGYATVPDFEIDVTYGENREITKVELTDNTAQIWVNPTFIRPSSETDLGYNGNENGIVKLEINSYYDFRVNIENVDRHNNSLKIVGTKYEVTSDLKAKGNAETNVNGIGTAHLDEVKTNRKVIYTIKEIAPSIDYQPLEIDEINLETEFDENGFIISGTTKVITGKGDQYSTASDIDPVVNDVDKFTINIQITSNPKFRMNITNKDYFDGTPLSGTEYKITSEVGNSIDNNVTDGNGYVHLRVDGNPVNKVIYTIHENKASSGYQSIEEDVKIEVVFNTDGTVNSCNMVQGNRFSSTSMLTNIVTTFDKFTINVEIRSVELLKFKLNNIYEQYDEDGNITNIQVAGSKYKISAIEVSENKNLNVDNLGVTEENGLATITMDKALSNKTIKYIINQEESAAGYKTLDFNIVLQVSFDNDGKIRDSSWSIIPNENGESSINFAKILNVNIDEFTIEVEIKSNKLVSFEINNKSTLIDEELGTVISVDPVVNTTYKISAVETSSNTNLKVDKKGSTDINGKTVISMDRGLANKTLHYTIKQEVKTVGYNWLESNIILEVSYDAQGRLIEDSVKIIPNSEGVSASNFTTITNVKVNDYKIYLDIENTPIKEFGIHLVARDIYTDAPIDGVKANVYLADNSKENNSLVSDQKYDFSVINKDMEVTDENHKYLYTGVDRDGDGNKDVADGEDYLSMGEYLEGKNTNRTLRVMLRDVPAPYQWYSNNTGSSQEFSIVISVKFDDEGRIVSTKLNTGLNLYVGWLADERYVSVTSTGYGLTIRLNFYPMLMVKMESQDMYTGEILESTLNLSTSTYPIGYDSNSDRIQEGYIGYTTSYGVSGSVYSVKSSHNYLRAAKSENNRTRKFYLYEESIPRQSESYYQKYRTRTYPYNSYYQQTRIGTIELTYDEKGQIKDAQVVSYTSNNNIKGGYIDLSWDNGYYLEVKVKYVPTTKIVAKLVDRVTGTPLSNIKVYPFNEGKQRYEYYVGDRGYETTASNGNASWTYWEANQEGTTSTYIMKTQFNSREYDGYFLPGDVKIDVGYGDTGRISAVKVLSQNLFGDADNAEAEWEDTTVYLTIKLDRKFNFKIHKKDQYDLTTNLSGVQFKIVSDKNEEATLYSWQQGTIGRVHAGKKVTYELSELNVPNGYQPLKNIRMYVEFNTDGTVERAYVDQGNEQYFAVQSKSTKAVSVNGTNNLDLEVVIKNTPTLGVTVNLTDEFYNSLKLSGGIFTLTNSKGDKASGNLVTNENGTFTTSIGKTYPNETVTYTLLQTNTINTYKANNEIMSFEVKYNEKGVIESYSVLNGESRYSITPNIHNGTKAVTLNVTNRPNNVNIGIVKIDENTGLGMNDIHFKVDITDVLTNKTTSATYITQNNISGDGTVAGKVDDVEQSTTQRAVKYKISEITIPNTYRKIQDIEVDVIYNEDGSIASYDVISNPSEVGIKVFRRQSNIEKINGIPTHIKLDIKNDNRYDLIIKNEDINYPGLGVEGTKYDVSINGGVKTLPNTDTTGITGLYKIDGSGEITIKIAENTIGSGYKADNENEVTIELEKGTEEYSLDLKSTTDGFIDDKNATTTKAIVKVDEILGTITVTFKNETKLEIDLIKNDINTGDVLEGAVFEIVSQEIDGVGNPIGDLTTITTPGENDTTPNNGRLYFNLGVTPQNKTIQYTIKEITPPEGYNEIEEMKVIAKFDMYGQLEQITDSSYRVNTMVNSNNKNGIVVIVGNGTIDPSYSIKVATVDSETNKRINDSKFNITVSKDDGTEIRKEINAVTDDNSKGGYLIEKGVVKLDRFTESGIINIDIDQIEAATGYQLSDKTSGTVKVEVTFTANSTDLETEIDLENVIESDGLEVITDNSNREILIIIRNIPEVTLHIDKYYEQIEKDETGLIDVVVNKPVGGAKFIITSEIQNSKEIITTDLYKETNTTKTDGKLVVGLDQPKAGKTVIYTIKEVVPEGYEEAEDVVVLVKYNTSGQIKYTEVLSDNIMAEITNSGKGTKEFGIRVKNNKKPSNTSYKVILRKHSIEDGEYDLLIPNTKYQINVIEEYGEQRSWTDITDENGMITSASFTGYGRIKIIYTELEAAEGYEYDEKSYEIEVNRDKATGKISQYSSDEGYEIDEKENIIYVDPKDELKKERYNLYVNKIDKENNKRIINNSAIFNVNLLEDQEIINGEETEIQTISTFLGTIMTNKDGIAKLDAAQMPENAGTYKFKITETKAPEGYEITQESYILEVTFEEDENQVMRITNIENLSSENVDILSTEEQVIKINIKNERKNIDLKEDEFALNITKIDSETKEAITENQAIFRIEDEEGNRQYIETDVEYGKLQIPYMKLPIISEFETSDSIERTYKLTEIMAPEGYLVDLTPINVNIKFTKTEENKVIIQEVKVIKEETKEQEAQEIEVTEENRIITFNLENKEGQLTNNVDRGRYTINITKVDEDTQSPITEHATFEITLENGEKVTASTDENGNIQIKDIKVPQTVTQNLGPYSYVIQETRAADGYELIDGYTIMELTFKELIDEETGKSTGLYGIDDINNIPVLTVTEQARITSYTEEEVNIIIGNKLSSKYVIYEDNVEDEEIKVPEKQEKILGQDLILSEMVPEREGYVFKGWTTTKESTQAEYQAGDTYSQHENITLYAIWEDKLYLKSTEYLIGTGDNPAGTWSPGDLSEYEEGDLYIKGIRPQAGIRIYANQVPSNEGTKLNEFLSNLETNADEIKVYIPEKDSEGNVILKEEKVVKEDQLVATAMIIKLTKGTQEIQLTLIVRGDVLNTGSTVGDGKVTNVEAARLKKLSGTTLTKDYTIEEQQAIDFDVNTTNRWSTNKQKIISAYQKHILEPLRKEGN